RPAPRETRFAATQNNLPPGPSLFSRPRQGERSRTGQGLLRRATATETQPRIERAELQAPSPASRTRAMALSDFDLIGLPAAYASEATYSDHDRTGPAAGRVPTFCPRPRAS